MKENWTEKHRNVTTKIFLEGGWTQKFDIIGRTPVNVKLAKKRKAQRSTGSTSAQNGTKSDERIPKVFWKLEQKARTSKKEWKWQRGIVEHLLSGSQWKRGHFSMKIWESEKHKSWSMPAEGFKGHIFAGKRWQVEGMWLGSGTVGL